MKNSIFSKFIKSFYSTGPDDFYCGEVRLNWHENFIVHLASALRPRIYVELGLYKCELFNRVERYAGKLIGVDINPLAGKYMLKCGKTIFKNMSTREFAKELNANPVPIDLLFIDADHSREAVIEDFNTFFPFVTPHGIILLHDGHPSDEDQAQPGYCGTGYLAIDELSKRTDEYEMMTIPVPPGLTLCRKRKTQLSWEECKR